MFTQHHIMWTTREDSKVTYEEFNEFYINIGAAIENDAYFGSIMNNAWDL